MKRLRLVLPLFFLSALFTQVLAATPKVILLITEQNISGPQRAWWASEVDLSTAESVIAQKLITRGITVLEPSSLKSVIRKDKAFRMVLLFDEKALKLGSLAEADYVVMGKAIASSGAKVPQSAMHSCFANITAKVIRVSDGKAITYLSSDGNAAHMDKITGGKEALTSAAEKLADKLIDALGKENN